MINYYPKKEQISTFKLNNNYNKIKINVKKTDTSSLFNLLGIYLGNEDFFSLTSNTGGGYTFYKDAKFRRLTRYRYNNVPVDDGGKYFYIKDADTIWSPGWKPMKTELDSYECRHGMSYTKFKSAKNGVQAEILQFIPLSFWGEVQKVSLKNTSAKIKSLKLFSFQPIGGTTS